MQYILTEEELKNLRPEAEVRLLKEQLKRVLDAYKSGKALACINNNTYYCDNCPLFSGGVVGDDVFRGQDRGFQIGSICQLTRFSK